MNRIISNLNISCPKDIGLVNIFQNDECEVSQFYGDCFHCWESSVAKYRQEIHNNAVNEFSNELMKYGNIDKTVVEEIKERLTVIPD